MKDERRTEIIGVCFDLMHFWLDRPDLTFQEAFVLWQAENKKK